MRRNATVSLDDLDPEVLDAARDVARRAGMPLQDWIESIVAPDAEAPRPRNARGAVDSASEAGGASVEETVRETTKRPRQPAPSEPSSEAPSARMAADAPARNEVEDAALAAMMARLDALDRSIAENRKAAETTTARAIERIEKRLASAVERGTEPSGAVTERLAEIERRMGEVQSQAQAQAAAPRPVGRRGRPLASEVRDAVEKVRQRQRELDAGGGLAPAASENPSPAITALQRETSKLRESLESLATGRDIGALETAMRALAHDVQRAQAPSDLAGVDAPIERLRAQVERLADEVADNVHARMSGDVERLADKVEGAVRGQPASFADRDALDGIHRELDEIRRQVGALAGPERIQGLAQGLQSISAQIAQLQGRADQAQGVDQLKPLLEEIREGLSAPDRSSKAILGRIDALADKVERAGVNPVGDLIGRLEDLGESLRRPQAPQDELAAIQRMLGNLAEKIDRVGGAGGAEGLDALERQIVGLARRLDARSADPAVAGLERMMDDLLKQVTALRDDDAVEAAVEAAVERATRRALAESVLAPKGGERGTGAGVESLRADLAELRARQVAADERLHTTMGGLNAALERLVERLGPVGAPASLQAGPDAVLNLPLRDEAQPAFELRASVAMPQRPAARAAAVQTPVQDRPTRRPAMTAATTAAPQGAAPAEESRLADELLDPGAGRPARARPAAPEAAPGGDVKANFIAAARRAAQAAQAEIESPADTDSRSPLRGERSRARITGTTAPSAPASPSALLGRIKAQADKRRRPLLLGLAAIVLVLGALQAFTMSGGDSASEGEVPVIAAKPIEAPLPKVATPESLTPPPVAQGPAGPSAAEKAPPPADPATTQSIAEAGGPRAPQPASKPAQTGIPKVAGMEAFKADLAAVPASLGTLRQAAMDGDGAALFELAAREAEGRGVPRDLALAAKLYEKLAQAGYAPAQFKLGSSYEKGSGVIRDLAQAKSWYGRAAEQGNVRAMHNLAVVHAENPAANGKPDFATASSWFRRAAEYGVRDSQYNLAVLYARGLGVGQDLVQSYLWFSAAADQGDDEAGRKRDDIASKLNPKDLSDAKGLANAFRAKVPNIAANDAPPTKAAPMSLIGAPPPGAPVPAPGTQRPAPAGV